MLDTVVELRAWSSGNGGNCSSLERRWRRLSLTESASMRSGQPDIDS